MSVEATKWAWKQKCTPMEKLILVALADHMNGTTGRTNPGTSRLIAHSGMTHQGIFNQIQKLERRGLLLVERCKGAVNNYVLPVNRVDPSTALTRQPDGLPPVNAVDYHQSTPLTGPVNGVDPNRKEPEVKPEIEPEGETLELIGDDTKKDVPRKKFDPLSVALPSILDTAAFREAWADFVQHRKEIKKPLTEIAARKSIKQLESWGHTTALVAIDNSCRNGYMGLFPPDKRDSNQSPQIPRGQVVAKAPICHD